MVEPIKASGSTWIVALLREGRVEMRLLVLYVFCVVLVRWSSAYDEGAPEEACSSMDPSAGHNVSPQTGPAPYETVPQQVTVKRGGEVKVVLRAINGTFKGFMTMAFDANAPESSAPIGTFKVDGSDAHTINCCGMATAITQTSDSYKANVTAVWRAPESFVGTVVFKTSFVKRKTEYWLKVPSTAKVSVTYCSGSAAITSNVVLWFGAVVLPLVFVRLSF